MKLQVKITKMSSELVGESTLLLGVKISSEGPHQLGDNVRQQGSHISKGALGVFCSPLTVSVTFLDPENTSQNVLFIRAVGHHCKPEIYPKMTATNQFLSMQFKVEASGRMSHQLVLLDSPS